MTSKPVGGGRRDRSPKLINVGSAGGVLSFVLQDVSKRRKVTLRQIWIIVRGAESVAEYVQPKQLCWSERRSDAEKRRKGSR